MANPENLVPHQWKPGQSGNPAGSSKKRRAVDHLLELIEERCADREIAAVWLAAILASEFPYFKEYLLRRDGPVRADDDTSEFTLKDLVEEAQKRAIARLAERDQEGTP